MTRGRAMTPDDVLCRYLEAKGSRGGDVERRRAALRKKLTGPVADYVDWLEREVAFCFESHGDAYGRATSSEGADMLPARREPRIPIVARPPLREPIVTHRSNGRGHLVDEVIIPLTGPAAEILRGALRAAQVHEADANDLAITGTGGLIAEMKRPFARRSVWTREELLWLLSSASDYLHGLIARLGKLATEPAERRQDKKAALRGVLDGMAAGSAVSPELLGIVRQATLGELCQLNAELAADGVETASEDAVAALHLALAGETDHTLVVHGKCTTTVSIRQRWPDSKEAS